MQATCLDLQHITMTLGEKAIAGLAMIQKKKLDLIHSAMPPSDSGVPRGPQLASRSSPRQFVFELHRYHTG